MTDKLELKSCHEVVYTVDVADVDSIFYCKPTDPDILTVLMKDGKRLYCDEVCPIDSLQEEPVSKELEDAAYNWVMDNYGNPKISSFVFEQRCFKASAQWQKKQIEKERFIKRELGFIKGYREKAIKELEKVENQESVKQDLEEEIEHYFTLWYDNEGGGCLKPDRWLNNLEDCKGIARHFANWQKENLWKPADGDDLPEIDREVVVLIKYNAQCNIYDEDYPTYGVGFGHRPNPYGWDGKSIATGKVEHYTPKTYDKGGWNIPNVKYWLDCSMPKEIEL